MSSPNSPVDGARGERRQPGPALAAGIEDAPGDQLDHAQPEGEAHGLALLEHPQLANGQQRQQRDRALQQRPLLGHGPDRRDRIHG
jgi:hypothetical protein